MEWLKYNSPLRCFDGKLRRGVVTDINSIIEVPADLAEIILATAPAREE